MMLFLAIFVVALALLLEHRMSANSLDEVQEDHWPDEKLVDPEEPFHLVLSLKNSGKHYHLFLKLEEELPQEFQVHQYDSHVQNSLGSGKKVTFTTWLRPHQEVQFRIPVSIPQRGQYLLHSLKVSGGDFLGLREQVRRLNQFRAVIVAPRETPEQMVSDVLGGFLGDISVRRFLYEDPVLTAGYREYTGREPMKMISWTQSARGRGLMVKQYDYTSEPTVSVLLNADSQSPEREALLERCFSLTRTVCRILEERGIQYDFATNADMTGSVADRSELGDGLGAQHFAAVLECLGRATYYAPYSGERLLEKSIASNSSRGRIVITPGDEFAASPALQRLQELSDGNLLLLRATEVSAW